MHKGKVLVIGSNATRIEVQGGPRGPTGQYLNETVVPAMAVLDAGYSIVLATPNGSKPHIDEDLCDASAFRWGWEGVQARGSFLRQPSLDEPRPYATVRHR